MFSPLLALLRSRKFLLLVLDTVISFVLWFIGQTNPDALENVQGLIAMLQPVFVAIIIAISIEDAAALKAGTHKSQA